MMRFHANGAVMLTVALSALLTAAPAQGAIAEPPITHVKNVFGKTIDVQVFPGTPVSFEPEQLSLAQRYVLGLSLNQDVQPFEVAMSCTIDPLGNVKRGDCYAKQKIDAGLDRIATIAIRDGLAVFPKFAVAKPPAGRPFDRRYDFLLRVGAFTRVQPDFSAGDLVDAKLVPSLRVVNLEYPEGAEHKGLGGVLTIECQIQRDLSVICRPVAMDPPANADYFWYTGYRVLQKFKASEFLADGAPAVGKRFRTSLRFTPPQ